MVSSQIFLEGMVNCGTLQNKYEHIELASLQLMLYFCAKKITSKNVMFFFHINHQYSRASTGLW